MKRILIILIIFITGFYYFLEYVLPGETHLSDGVAPLGDITLVLGVFGFFLAIIHLTRSHLHRIQRRQPGWYNSFALILSMIIMAAITLWNYFSPDTSLTMAYDILFNGIFNPLKSTIFALLAFYIASAAYRAFRIRTVEAGVMMFVALFVMLGQISFGQQLTNGLVDYEYAKYLQLHIVRHWIMDIWNGAAQRGIFFGALIGMLAMAIRIWLSLERGFFTEDK